MKTLTIAKKISLGFAGVVFVTMLMGIFSLFTARSGLEHSSRLSDEFVPEARVASRLNEVVGQMRGEIQAYDLTGKAEYLNSGRELGKEVHLLLEEAKSLGRKFPELVKLNESIDQMVSDQRSFEASILECERQVLSIDRSREQLAVVAAASLGNLHLITEGLHKRLNAACENAEPPAVVSKLHKRLRFALSIVEEEEEARVTALKAQIARDPQLMAVAIAAFDSIEAHMSGLQELLDSSVEIAELDHARDESLEYRKCLVELQEAQVRLGVLEKQQKELSDKLEAACAALADRGMSQAVAEANATSVELKMASSASVIGLLLTLLMSAGLGWFIVSSTSRQLAGIANRLGLGSRQLEAAASMISQASSTLANTSCEQAAALEETSASIEEIGSVTDTTSRRAAEAKSISNETRSILDQGVQNMSRLRQAMQDMDASSTHISKIISSIDEIAFQTNLLALNAAVEAARAGEAGAGFSVVAEEVRALALRSAKAARETTANIEAALKNSKGAELISREMDSSLQEIVGRVKGIDSMIEAISLASREQSIGIEQINNAIAQIDQTTQENASASEECASNSTQLKGQSTDLNEIVGELEALCGVSDSSRMEIRHRGKIGSNHRRGGSDGRGQLVSSDAGRDSFFNN